MAITHLKTFGSHSGFGQLIRQAKADDRITMVNTTTGEVRYECRTTDTQVAGSGSNIRAETYTRCETLGTNVNNVTRWIAFAYQVEAGPIPANTHFGFCWQTHGPNNTGQAQVSISTLDGFYTLRLWDAGTKKTILMTRLKTSGGADLQALAGQWIYVIFRIVFSTSPSIGRVEGWSNGTKFVDRNMQVHYTTDVDGNSVAICTYIKEGIYTNQKTGTYWRRMRMLQVGTADETLQTMAAMFPEDSGFAGAGGDQDTLPPAVAITAPAAGAVVSGTTPWSADASDEGSGVARVEFRVGGSPILTDTTAPYGFAWDTTQHPDGPLTLEARAVDVAGNAASDFREVTVANDVPAPVVETPDPVPFSFTVGVPTLVETPDSEIRSFIAGNLPVETPDPDPFSFTLSSVVLPPAPPPLPDEDVPTTPSREARAAVTVRARQAGGTWSTIGSDDGLGVVPEQLTCDADLSGPNTAAFKLARDVRVERPDTRAFTDLEIEVGGHVVWAGRVAGAPGGKGQETSQQVQGEGWQRHLEDDLTMRFWLHRRMSDWRDVRGLLGANLARMPAQTQVVTDRGAITIGWPQGANYKQTDTVGITLDQDVLLGRRARRVVIEVEAVNPHSFATLYVRSTDLEDPISTPFSDFFNVSLGAIPTDPTTYSGSLTTSRRYLSIFLFVAAASPGTTSLDHQVRLRSIRLMTQPTYEAGGESQLRASDVILDVLPMASRLSADYSGVQTSGFMIPHVDTGGGFQSARQIADTVNAYHDWLFGVDHRARPFFRPKPQAATLEVGEWSGASWQDQSISDTAGVFNRVIVEGQDGSGEPLRVIRTRSVPSLDRAGVVRSQVLSVGAVLTPASAARIGDIWLAERARMPFRGELEIAGHGAVRRIGTSLPLHPAELLREYGSMIRLPLEDPETRGWGRDGRIVSISYDHSTQGARVSLDNRPGALEALLARLGVLQEAFVR